MFDYSMLYCIDSMTDSISNVLYYLTVYLMTVLCINVLVLNKVYYYYYYYYIEGILYTIGNIVYYFNSIFHL